MNLSVLPRAALFGIAECLQRWGAVEDALTFATLARWSNASLNDSVSTRLAAILRDEFRPEMIPCSLNADNLKKRLQRIRRERSLEEDMKETDSIVYKYYHVQLRLQLWSGKRFEGLKLYI